MSGPAFEALSQKRRKIGNEIMDLEQKVNYIPRLLLQS